MKFSIPIQDSLVILRSLSVLGAVPVPFELSARNHFQPDLDEIAAKITRRTRMLITNSPGNPTGHGLYRRGPAGLGANSRSSTTSGFFPTKSTRAYLRR